MTSPFSIDTGADVIGRKYRILSQIQSQLLAAAPQDRFGFFFDDEPASGKQESWTKVIGDYRVIVERCFVFGGPGAGAGLGIHQGDGKFLCAGRGFQVHFESIRREATFTGILYAAEKEYRDDGKLHTLRVLNGDETREGKALMMPNDDPDYGGFPIAVTVPART